MKKTPVSKTPPAESQEMLPEYNFDYRQARPNRFAGQLSEERLVALVDQDVAQVFTTAESVNNVLRAVVTALPKAAKPKTARKQKHA
ncbi:MAG: hypothetical protein HYR56_06040 [Acidobacteria bacterium]|nr:hypothetical protein [Acidobacteriota bacterium]MBI3421669.1 hypothetical protein [Acidobacteriota bacterium]